MIGLIRIRCGTSISCPHNTPLAHLKGSRQSPCYQCLRSDHRLITGCYADRHKNPLVSASESIHGTANSGRSAIEDMGIDHRRLDIAMAQEFLDRSDIVTPIEQVRGEGMAERMTSGPLPYAISFRSNHHTLAARKRAMKPMRKSASPQAMPPVLRMSAEW